MKKNGVVMVTLFSEPVIHLAKEDLGRTKKTGYSFFLGRTEVQPTKRSLRSAERGGLCGAGLCVGALDLQNQNEERRPSKKEQLGDCAE